MATAPKKPKRKTPARATGRLAIFLSYASEDEPFARAIGQRLSDIFRHAVQLTYMSDFPLGVNYRTLIDQAVDGADILLIIATGREKPSHSFTGYEVGYFRKSQQARKYVDDQLGIQRLIIPFAIFAHIPAPVGDIQGIGITEKDAFLYDLGTAGKIDDKKQDPFFKLLERINGILNELNSIKPSLDEQQRTRDEFRREAESFYEAVKTFMSSLPLSREFPKPRLTLRLPADLKSKNIKIDDRVLLSCKGPTAGIFGAEQSVSNLPWAGFSKLIGSESGDVALYWNDALSSLVESTLQDKFVESDLVPSYDQKRFFRLFVSESRTFVDAHELDIYLVEPSKDAGDPFTTFLAKAIAIAMAYRSLFWEDEGPYGRQAHYWRPEEWKSRISELRRDLRNLFVQTRASGLAEPTNIEKLYGSDRKEIESMRAMEKTFRDLRDKLYTSANAVVAESKPTYATFDAFSNTLDEFRTQTKDMNTMFATKVLQHLERVLKEG